MPPRASAPRWNSRRSRRRGFRGCSECPPSTVRATRPSTTAGRSPYSSATTETRPSGGRAGRLTVVSSPSWRKSRGDRSLVRQEVRPPRRNRDTGQGQALVERPVVDVQVQRVLPRGRGLVGDPPPVVQVTPQVEGPASVDGLTVRVEPLAHLVEALDGLEGHVAVAPRADVQHEVAVQADVVDERLEQGRRGLPAAVQSVETPGVGDGPRALPGVVEAVLSELVVPHRSEVDVRVLVDRQAEAGVDETAGLQLANELLQLGELLLRDDGLGVVDPHVEPHQADGTVAGEELPHLRDHLLLPVLVELLGGDRMELVGVVPPVGVLPVHPVGVVEPQLQSVLPTGLGQLPDDVPPGVGELGHVVAGDLAVPEGEPVVVLGGEGHVLHARALRQEHPLLGVDRSPVEPVEEGQVLVLLDAVAVLDPLRVVVVVAELLALPDTLGAAVDPPVDEHAEPRVDEPLRPVVGQGLSGERTAAEDKGEEGEDRLF